MHWSYIFLALTHRYGILIREKKAVFLDTYTSYMNLKRKQLVLSFAQHQLIKCGVIIYALWIFAAFHRFSSVLLSSSGKTSDVLQGWFVFDVDLAICCTQPCFRSCSGVIDTRATPVRGWTQISGSPGHGAWDAVCQERLPLGLQKKKKISTGKFRRGVTSKHNPIQ